MFNKRMLEEGERRRLTVDAFVHEVLFAIFCKMKEEGYEEISLKASDLLEVLPHLEKLFQKFGIISEAFCKEPVSEEYTHFSNYVIQILYARGYGFFNVDYNKISININDYMIQKTLKENERIMDIVDIGYLIMTNQIEKLESSFQFVKNKVYDI